MNRIISWFSCGAASAVATKLALGQYGKDNFIAARCVVHDEHYDNDRFADDCAKWFKHPVTSLVAKEYGGSVDEVIRRRSYMSGVAGAPCTLLLKKEVRKEFETVTDKHIFGYTADSDDIARFDQFLDANNIYAEAPLIERGITHADCLAIVQDAGITLPTMYKLGYKHNNCIGCVKATGAGYWNKIRDDFPYVFEKRCAQSKRLGVKLVRIGEERIFLEDLPSGIGDYQKEPEIQCGIFCHLAKEEIGSEE